MNLKKIFLGALVFISSACSGCTKDETKEPEFVSPITWTECGDEVGDHACDFTLDDQDGDEWNLYSHYGSPIIIDFSAEWCGYCQVAAANTQHVSDTYEQYNLIYVTVLIEDSAGNPGSQELLDRWSSFFEITDPVLAGGRSMLDDGSGTGWEIAGWPTFFIVDDEMKIDSIIRGYSEQSLDQAIQDVIAKESQNSLE